MELQEALKKFAEEHPEYATPTGARNMCVYASVQFLKTLGAERGDWYQYMRMGFVNGEEHHWVEVDGHFIDWTARQYISTAPFPKIWETGDWHDDC